MKESILKPQTLATLQELESASWFMKVGIRDTESALVLSSWDEAERSCSSAEWEDLCLEAANRYRTRLMERNPLRLKEWNAIVSEVKAVSVPLVHRKTADVLKEQHLGRGFVDTVQWDILHVCMEAEFADVFPPGFFASQAYWYLKGHFPCGWQGEFPDGLLVIY